MKISSLAILEQQVHGTKLSMIYDTETINEEESNTGGNVQDENV
jgi:hypothetical protein